jgi:hypothetical protein
MAVKRSRKPAVGWREWAALPQLGIAAIKAKLDTGARSSALHAFDLVRREDGEGPWVEFAVHPLQRDRQTTVRCRARLVDERWVRSSSGRRTFRPVIETVLVLGERRWPIQLTLVRRDLMGFRLLVGREALRRRLVVDPGRSFLAGPAAEPGEEGEESVQVAAGGLPRRSVPAPRPDAGGRR